MNSRQFLQKLEELEASAGGSRQISRQDIEKTFAQMHLEEDLLLSIVTYLQSKGFQVVDLYEGQDGEEKEGESASAQQPAKDNSVYDPSGITLPAGCKAGENLLTYLDDLRSLPVLEEEEQQELARKAGSGDEQAVSALVTSNLWLVFFMARDIFPRHPDSNFFDMIQEGNIGLIRAAGSTGEFVSGTFTHFAMGYIREAIYDYLRQAEGEKNLPGQILDDICRYVQIRDELSEELDHEPDIYEIAGRMEVDSAWLEDFVYYFKDSIPSQVQDAQADAGADVQGEEQ